MDGPLALVGARVPVLELAKSALRGRPRSGERPLVRDGGRQPIRAVQVGRRHDDARPPARRGRRRTDAAWVRAGCHVACRAGWRSPERPTTGSSARPARSSPRSWSSPGPSGAPGSPSRRPSRGGSAIASRSRAAPPATHRRSSSRWIATFGGGCPARRAKSVAATCSRTSAWFRDQGLHVLMGTIRYPKAA